MFQSPVMPPDLKQTAMAAWQRARDHVYQSWTRETDPANLQPRVSRFNRRLAELLGGHPPRARLRLHLEGLKERFPHLLGGCEVKESIKTDYAFRIFVDKPIWAQVVAGLTEDLDYDNFKSEVARFQGRDGADYEHSLHEVWSVIVREVVSGIDAACLPAVVEAIQSGRGRLVTEGRQPTYQPLPDPLTLRGLQEWFCQMTADDAYNCLDDVLGDCIRFYPALWSFINKTGEFAIRPQFHHLAWDGGFHDSAAAIQDVADRTFPVLKRGYECDTWEQDE